MNLKTLGLILIFFLGFTFSNCNECDCRGIRGYFNIIDLTAAHQLWQLDDTFVEIDMFAPFTFDSYAGTYAKFDTELVASLGDCKNMHFSTIPSAMSCSCIEPGSLGSKEERFSEFDVITVFDYDDDHPAGTSLLSMLSLQIFVYDEYEIYEGMLETYLEEQAGRNVEHNNYLLKPLTPPTSMDSMQLMIKIRLNNGEEYEILTDVIEFL